jgi:murein L,D-transpeptidase YafK
MNIRFMLIGMALFLTSCATVDTSTQDFAIDPNTVVTRRSDELLPMQKVDQIVVYKSQRRMYLMKEGRIIRKYQIALGKNPVGHKLQWGDNRTPEGKYTIDLKNNHSSYFLSMRISYPDKTDSNVAASLAMRPGDWVMIHGMPNDRGPQQVGHPNRDWTNGCIAVTNPEMAEIWQMVGVGTQISIWP